METEGLLGRIHEYCSWAFGRKEKLKQVMRWVLDLDVPYLTVYALSSENISNRPKDEIDVLYDLYIEGLNEIALDP